MSNLPKEVREAMARAMWAYFVSRHPDPDSFLLWEELRPSTHDDYRNNVDAALSALGEAGYAVVPVEATNAMMDAGIDAARRELPPLEQKAPGFVQMRAAWTAMLEQANV